VESNSLPIKCGLVFSLNVGWSSLPIECGLLITNRMGWKWCRMTFELGQKRSHNFYLGRLGHLLSWLSLLRCSFSKPSLCATKWHLGHLSIVPWAQSSHHPSPGGSQVLKLPNDPSLLLFRSPLLSSQALRSTDKAPCCTPQSPGAYKMGMVLHH
jgi:hypothetical protein